MTVPAAFNVKDRGATPRGMARRLNGMKKECWVDTATLFHTEMRDKRFTHSHATAAGYAKRSRKYLARKLKAKKHTYPLQWSGRTRRDVRAASITTQTNGARVAYAGARKFNFRNPKSQANMAQEFTTILLFEANELAAEFDKSLDNKLKSDNVPNN